MKKLLYIAVNSKPEELSTSKQVGREFINRFREMNPEYEIMELDLYNEDIPEINYKLFTSRAELASGKSYNDLTEEDRKKVDRINALADQFISADCYVIAAPMWSVDCPSRLKRYIDCVVINNKSIKISSEKVSGLLGDKKRSMLYIQSSGGVYPKIFDGKFNHAVNYCDDLFKFLGVKVFEKLLVEGVDSQDVGKDVAKHKAYRELENIIENMT